MNVYTTGNGKWVGTQADARKLSKETGLSWEHVDIPTTSKQEMLEFLNGFRVLTLEGSDDEDPIKSGGELGDYIHDKEVKPSYTHQSVALDDVWAELPLARKLHFAALAMEDARNAL